MDLKHKTIVVTGGANGMGRELTLLLLAKGARVAAVDINKDALRTTVSLAGSNAAKLSTHILDITDHEAVKIFPEEVIKAHGQVDVLINNAGIIQPFVDVKELDFDQIDRVINVNLYGTLYLTKAFLPYFLNRPEAYIANVSSMGGFLPVPGQSIYCATKAAVKLLTEGLYAELKNTSVRVSIIFPGAIGTDITTNSGVASPKRSSNLEESKAKTLSPVKAAEIIVSGIERNKTRIFVGKDASLMDKLYRFSPSLASNMIAKKLRSS